MTPSRVFTVTAFCLFAVSSAGAQSSLVDLSTPMTGKSAYVFNHDGTPVELGARNAAKPQPVAHPAAEEATWGGAAAIDESQAQAQAMAAGGRTVGQRRRSGGATLVVINSGRGADEKKARPQRKAGFRIGRRGRR